MPAASLISTAAGGVFVMKVNERSSKTVISTGMMRPFWSCVWALNVLQNSMMFTPCWPRAGPTGGAGVAWPAGIWSLMYPVTFLAMVSFLIASALLRRLLFFARIEPVHLEEVELHRGGAPEDRHH